MRITKIHPDGSKTSFRPDDILEDLANLEGQTRENFITDVRLCFPGNPAQWYDDIADQWCGPGDERFGAGK